VEHVLVLVFVSALMVLVEALVHCFMVVLLEVLLLVQMEEYVIQILEFVYVHLAMVVVNAPIILVALLGVH
jgi:hypothetical protein